MIYIIVALHAEAKPLIHHFQLQRLKQTDLALFSNKMILLCITQVGLNHATTAIKKVFEYRKPQDNDILINIGLCGAPSRYKIASLLIIDELRYKLQKYKLSLHVNHSFQTSTLTTVTEAQNNFFKTPVDMEAFAIFESASKSMQKEKIFFIKIVSDHFKPETLDKNLAYALINRQMENLSILIKNLQRNQECQQQ